MCGHYTFIPNQELIDQFKQQAGIDLNAAYDIFPKATVPIINRDKPALATWGITPPWQDKTRPIKPLINARIETVSQKSTFIPLLKTPCLIPATSFFEWGIKDGKKIPYHLTLPDHPRFFIAGLLDDHNFIMLTTQANQDLAPIHPRMPVILTKKQETDWLKHSTDQNLLNKLTTPYPQLTIQPVSHPTL